MQGDFKVAVALAPLVTAMPPGSVVPASPSSSSRGPGKRVTKQQYCHQRSLELHSD